jgi:hypothetical protein
VDRAWCHGKKLLAYFPAWEKSGKIRKNDFPAPNQSGKKSAAVGKKVENMEKRAGKSRKK